MTIGQNIFHYIIVEKLGEGGMGVVYKAEDTKLKRDVAIKFLPHQISDNKEERQRFEIEAQAAAALNHPNIATIHAIEESEKEVFIVMEFINGIELKQKISKALPSIEESLNIIEQTSQGLKAAHDKGITHRDIKSSNVMITESGQIKIMDFGLAKMKGVSHITRFGTTLGTTAYMSPEQARGEQVDHRTDIWSLGVIAFELLTGKTPYEGEFEQAIIYSILNEEPKSVLSVRKDVPLKLDQLVMKMLSKNKEHRYQNVSEILLDLKELKLKSKQAPVEKEKKTIAVLPFENISPDKDADYFAEGLAEELITSLAKIKEIKLVAPANTMKYKGTDKDIKTLGRELAAGYIMQGSVRKFKDDLRISVKLMDVAQESQLWGETYKGKLEDVFDIQEKVSKEIVDALRVNLSLTEKVVLSKRSTLNAEAFDNYLRARNFLYRLTKNNVHLAIQLFNKAIELDPRYAAAHAGLGEAYATLYQYFETNDSYLDKAIESSLKALMYDPTLSEAYTALGLAYFDKKLLEEAITSTLKAIELDSENYVAYWILGRIYHTTDRTDEAIQQFKKTIALNPDFYNAFNDIIMAYERINDMENAKRALDEALEKIHVYLAKNPDDARAHMYHAIHLAAVNKNEEAIAEGKKALELNPGDSLMMYNAACLYARLGDNHLSIETLKNAIAAGQEDFEWIKRDSDLDSIRNEPEYIELMKGK
jgi:TolB-like protein/Flp pilus assembly protein TadD/predicted Ser/Thr protein kinase